LPNKHVERFARGGAWEIVQDHITHQLQLLYRLVALTKPLSKVACCPWGHVRVPRSCPPVPEKLPLITGIKQRVKGLQVLEEGLILLACPANAACFGLLRQRPAKLIGTLLEVLCERRR